MDPVYDTLVSLLTDKFEAPADKITPDITLGELELDSLAVVELYVTLQEHYGIPLDDTTALAFL